MFARFDCGGHGAEKNAGWFGFFACVGHIVRDQIGARRCAGVVSPRGIETHVPTTNTQEGRTHQSVT